MTSSTLKQFYTIDPYNGEYIIEIGIDDYKDIFNSWDSSSYTIRDLDTSLKDFLVKCSKDISIKHKVILRFNLATKKRDMAMEKLLEQGIRNYFLYSLYNIKNELTINTKRSIYYLLTSIIFVVLSFYFQSTKSDSIFEEILLLSISIGSWIFLWEAFSIVFLQRKEILKKRKQYKRLLHSPIIFKY